MLSLFLLGLIVQCASAIVVAIYPSPAKAPTLRQIGGAVYVAFYTTESVMLAMTMDPVGSEHWILPIADAPPNCPTCAAVPLPVTPDLLPGVVHHAANLSLWLWTAERKPTAQNIYVTNGAPSLIDNRACSSSSATVMRNGHLLVIFEAPSSENKRVPFLAVSLDDSRAPLWRVTPLSSTGITHSSVTLNQDGFATIALADPNSVTMLTCSNVDADCESWDRSKLSTAQPAVLVSVGLIDGEVWAAWRNGSTSLSSLSVFRYPSFGTWVDQSPTAVGYGASPSIAAVDGRPAVSFFSSISGASFVKMTASGGWVLESLPFISGTASVGSGTSLTTVFGFPAIAFSEGGKLYFAWASQVGGTWETSSAPPFTFPPTTVPGSPPSPLANPPTSAPSPAYRDDFTSTPVPSGALSSGFGTVSTSTVYMFVSPSTPQQAPSTALIVGVVCALACLVIVLLLIFLAFRHRKRASVRRDSVAPVLAPNRLSDGNRIRAHSGSSTGNRMRAHSGSKGGQRSRPTRSQRHSLHHSQQPLQQPQQHQYQHYNDQLQQQVKLDPYFKPPAPAGRDYQTLQKMPPTYAQLELRPAYARVEPGDWDDSKNH